MSWRLGRTGRESAGLAEPVRSTGGHRLYPADTVVLLTVIKAAQRLGFTLDEVAALLEQTLLAVAAVLAAAALGIWWPHRRRSAQRATAGGAVSGCGSGDCGC